MPFESEDIVKCTLRFSLFNASLAINSFTARLSQVIAHGSTDEDAVTDWAAHLDNFYGELLQMMHDLSVPTTFELHRLNLGNWDWVTGGEPTFVPTSVGDIVAHGVAALIVARTAVSKVRGRKFVPGITDVAIADGLFNQTMVTNLVAAAAIYVMPFESVTDDSEWTSGVYSKGLATFIPFIPTAVVTNIPSYQRRRKPGVGA
jgi:hypothetical protein